MLTEAERAQFWRDGAVVVDDVLSAAELETLRSAYESPAVTTALAEAGYNEGGVHLLTATTLDPSFRALALSSKIVTRVASLIGVDLQLQHSKLATKPPVQGKGAFAWHQDFAFFPHTNTDLVAVMVMLDDATPENGCMSIVQGSHTRELLNHRVDGWFTGCSQVEPGDQDTLIALTPRAGGISIHHCLTLHSSPPNQSSRPRRGLVLQYRNSDAHQLADTVFADTGLQVSGTYSGRARCTEGTWDLPRWPVRGYGDAWRHVGSSAQAWNGPDGEVSARAASVRFAK